MKSHELAKILLGNPDYDVSLSVDVYGEEKDYKVFAFSLIESVVCNDSKEIVLLFEDGLEGEQL